MESPLGFHKDTIETPWRIICDPIEIPRRSRTVFTDTSELMVVEDEYTDADGHGYEYGYGYRYAYGYGYGDGDGDGDAGGSGADDDDRACVRAMASEWPQWGPYGMS